MSWPAAVALLAAVCVAAPAGASDEPPPRPPTFAERLVHQVRTLVDAAIIARPPKLVPPKKVALRWKLAKLGTVELGAPLVTLAAADLDADGTAELYAVTPRDVIAIAAHGGKLRELGRVALTGERSVAGPRDVVATALADGTSLLVGVSTYARSQRVTWRGGALVAEPGAAGFPQCPGELVPLTAGRNTFGDAASAHLGARCTSQLVDGDGYPLRARAQLSLASKLDVAVERCAATNLGCQPTARHEYAGVGYAFAVADVDRDGVPEALLSGAGAPGDPDSLRVITLGDSAAKPKLKKAFAAGGIAAIAVGDLDANGTSDVIVAVRAAGAPRVELWRLE